MKSVLNQALNRAYAGYSITKQVPAVGLGTVLAQRFVQHAFYDEDGRELKSRRAQSIADVRSMYAHLLHSLAPKYMTQETANQLVAEFDSGLAPMIEASENPRWVKMIDNVRFTDSLAGPDLLNSSSGLARALYTMANLARARPANTRNDLFDEYKQSLGTHRAEYSATYEAILQRERDERDAPTTAQTRPATPATPATEFVEASIVQARRLALEALDSNPDKKHRSTTAIRAYVTSKATTPVAALVGPALDLLINDRLVTSRPSAKYGTLYSRVTA